MAKIIHTQRFAPPLIIGFALFARAYGQNLSYDEVVSMTASYEKQKTYDTLTSGPQLHSILQGLLDNYQYRVIVSPENVYKGHKLIDTIYEEYYYGYSDGLKVRLLYNVSARKLQSQAAAAVDERDAKFLELLYYTRQSPVPTFMTDRALASDFGYYGVAIYNAEVRFWKSKAITEDLMDVIGEYPPAEATNVFYVIAQPFFSGTGYPGKPYEDKIRSWASQSLWQVYFLTRQSQIAARSAVVKLLIESGQLQAPRYAPAQFIYSGWETRSLGLPAPEWTDDDIPRLQRLVDNPYYGEAARAQLAIMTSE